MRGHWFTVLSLSLLGCGAHSTLATGGTDGGAGTGGQTTAQLSRIQTSCAPNDGAAIALTVDGTSSCAATPITGGVQFLVWGQDLAGLGPGAMLTVGSDVNAPTQGFRVGSPVPMTGGTLTFTTYQQGQGGTGTFSVTFMDGSTAEGSFDAVWCPGGGQCG